MRFVAVLLLGLLGLFLVSASAGPAFADDTEKNKREALKLLGQGDRLFKKGDYEGALAKYQKAYETYPSPQIYYPLAKTEEQLGRDLDALAHYEALLSEGGDDVPEPLRKEAAERILALEQKIAVVDFDIYPRGATVSIDDIEIGVAPLSNPVRLPPGPHKYTIAANGYKTVDMEVELEPGDRPIVELKLEPERTTPIRRKPRPQPAEEDQPPGSGRGLLYVGIGVTGALVLGGSITGIIASTQHSIFSDTGRPMDEREAARSTGETLALTTDLMLVGAVISGGFTAYWYYKVVKPREARLRDRRARPAAPGPGDTAPDDGGAPPENDEEDEEEAPPTTLVTPWVSPQGGGIAVTGWF